MGVGTCDSIRVLDVFSNHKQTLADKEIKKQICSPFTVMCVGLCVRSCVNLCLHVCLHVCVGVGVYVCTNTEEQQGKMCVLNGG